MNAPTPGSWVVESIFDRFNVYTADESCLCIARDCNEADARLIAAAPDQHELLETLREWTRQIAAREDVPRGIRSAAAALHDDCKRVCAKATQP